MSLEHELKKLASDYPDLHSHVVKVLPHIRIVEAAQYSVVKEGRRFYIQGNTYAIKDVLKKHKFKWDADKKMWWTGQQKRVDDALKEIGNAEPEQDNKPSRRDLDNVIGKAQYKGRYYYVLWKGRTRSGKDMVRLMFNDASTTFWADSSRVVYTPYREPRRFEDLKAYASRKRDERANPYDGSWDTGGESIDLSYRGYLEYIDWLDEMDHFQEAHHYEAVGYRVWKEDMLRKKKKK